MRLHDIMTQPVETIDKNEFAEHAWKRMRDQRIHHLVVTDPEDGIVGVLSDRDLAGPNGSLLRGDWIVADAMTRDPLCVPPHLTVRQAANLLRGRSIGCLPIVEKGQLLGIVTVSDLLELVGRGSIRPFRSAQ
jgi:acetoin utilization protein AcuB